MTVVSVVWLYVVPFAASFVVGWVAWRLWQASREPLFPLFEDHRRERELADAAKREPFSFPFAPPARLARIARLKDAA